MRYTDNLKRVANFLNHGWVHGRKGLKNNPGIERLRGELKQDLRRVLNYKVPADFLGALYQKSIAIPPIAVTANGELVGSLLLIEGRFKPGLTTLEFVMNDQAFGKLPIDYQLSELDEYRAALYKIVYRAVFDRTIGKLRQCGWCEQYFLSTVPRQAYCGPQCRTEARHEQIKNRVQKWRKKWE